MAYLGNQPVVGDSANTFKLLDDISTFTLTFDGSSASVVSVANNTLTFANHRFVTGQRVTYGKGGGTVITGLTDATAYFIIKVDQSTIKLATNASNAASSTAIDLTGLGAGTSHTLNVAFDGVNTKFKATHTDGTKANVSRAAQLSLSINGVIQQPTETKPPTVGYGIEADSTIVFSTAPVSTDKAFGSFIGEVAPSFDLTDNTVDNFTGDGSTTIFNLSKEVPSSQDVLVTLDGVTQYPSDTSTTRAYSVIGQTLTFVSAPADGVAIQARHIGFAGATTSEVTGFYGRTGNVALKSTDDITFQNASAGIITASQFVGVITATDVFVSGIATFASDVGIAGTLTYEDVTNIDSVGLITARNGIVVGSGITLSKDGDIFATGITTFSKSGTAVRLTDGSILRLGNEDADFFLYHDGSSTDYISAGTGKQLRLTTDDFIIKGAGNSETLVTAVKDGAVTLYNDNSAKLATSASGVTVTGTVAATSYTGDGSALTGIAATDNVRTGILDVAGVGTFRSNIFQTSGRIVRGSTSTIQDGDAIAGGVNITGTDMDASVIMSVFGNDSDFNRISGAKSRNATIGSHTVVNDGDTLLSLKGFGSDGTDFEEAAQIEFQVDGSPGDNDMPGRIVFKTTADGAASPTERLRIASDGKLFTTRTHASSDTGNHPALDIDTYSHDGSPQAAMATGIDFSVEGVHKKRLAVTYADSSAGTGDWIFYRDQGNNEGLRIHASGQVSVGEDTSNSHDYKFVVKPNRSDTSKAALGLLVDGDSGQGGGVASEAISAKIVNTNTFNNATHQYAAYIVGGQQYTAPVTACYVSASGTYNATMGMRVDLTKHINANTDGFSYYSKVVESNSGSGVAYHFRGEDNGNIRINIEKDGDIKNTNNSYGSLSDVKLKENIVDANSQWDDIKALRIRNFNFKDDPDKVKLLGVVAQEAEVVSAGLVDTSNDIETDATTGEGTVTGTTKYVKYSILYMKAVKALQEAQTRIETLETKVAALEG